MASERQSLGLRARFAKWAGFYLGTLAALLDQQVISATVYARCPVHVDVFTLTVSGACALLAVIGGVISLRERQRLPREATASTLVRADRFIATLAGVFAFFCVLFILFAAPAGWILRCER